MPIKSASYAPGIQKTQNAIYMLEIYTRAVGHPPLVGLNFVIQ